MVEQAHVDQRQGVAQRASDRGVGAARFGGAAGVVVRDDDGARVGAESELDELARVHGRLVDGAAKEFVGGEQTVAVVEQQGVEDLVLESGEPQAQPVLDAFWIGEEVGLAGGFGQRPAGEFEGGLELRVFGQPLARYGGEGSGPGVDERAHATEVCE